MHTLQLKCPTLRGNKEEKKRRQPVTCQRFHPNTRHLFHLVSVYITQGRPDGGLFRLTPRPQAIITQRIGVYATPLLQPTETIIRTAHRNLVYIYPPKSNCSPTRTQQN